MYKILALLLASMLPVLDAAAQENSCPPYGHEITLNVHKDYGRLVYDHSKSREELQELAGGSLYHRNTAGLTIAEFGLNVSADSEVRLNENGSGYCIYLDTIDLYLSYDDIHVLIDSKYPEGSCQYKVILEHEMKHVAVHKKSLDYYAPYIIGAMEKAVEHTEPRHSMSQLYVDEIVNEVVNDFLEQITGMLEFFESERNAANARLDTESSYEGERRKCPSW